MTAVKFYLSFFYIFFFLFLTDSFIDVLQSFTWLWFTLVVMQVERARMTED